MATLTAHLRTPEDHGRLAFHPQCPLCVGERLAGTLPADVVVTRRGQALVAAGVLALSSAAPATTLAADPDQEQEGSAAPEQIVAADPQGDSSFDPGGETTDLPLVPPPAAEESAPEATVDVAPVEPEPATDDAPAVDEEVVSVAPETPPTPAPVAPPAAAPLTPEPAVAPEPVAVPPSVAQEREPAPRRRPRDDDIAQRPRPAATAPPAVTPQPEPRHVAAVQVAPAPTTAGSAATAAQAARRGDRFHVVRPGESLWSIASDLAGEGASPARIAREVNRLWELNSARIGTGDPDLLMAETRLVLR